MCLNPLFYSKLGQSNFKISQIPYSQIGQLYRLNGTEQTWSHLIYTRTI